MCLLVICDKCVCLCQIFLLTEIQYYTVYFIFEKLSFKFKFLLKVLLILA